jgi:hypothetical protein
MSMMIVMQIVAWIWQLCITIIYAEIVIFEKIIIIFQKSWLKACGNEKEVVSL